MKPFRIATISLDEGHNVAGITVVIDAPYLSTLNSAVMLPLDSRDLIVRSERGDTELWVDLDVRQLLDLFRTAGNWTGDSMQIPGAYDALTLVVYGLMED